MIRAETYIGNGWAKFADPSIIRLLVKTDYYLEWKKISREQIT